MSIMQEVNLLPATFSDLPEEFRDRPYIGIRVHEIVSRPSKTHIFEIGLLSQV